MGFDDRPFLDRWDLYGFGVSMSLIVSFIIACCSINFAGGAFMILDI
jgi:NADH:ubiquinone oxidoreductase subunit B-like Fe-S oxidoreductase